MNNTLYQLRLKSLLFLLHLLLSLQSLTSFAFNLTPSTTPEQVINSQLTALQNDDMNGVFQLASPRNKANVGGDIHKFASMVKSGPYRFLIGHSKAVVLLESTMVQQSKRYLVRVVTTTSAPNDETKVIHEYWWALSRCQIDGPFLDCYMVDAVIPDYASRELISAYLNMRKLGSSGGQNGSRTISATPRQLESLIRLSEAQAKLRFSKIVTSAHVKEAVRLMRVATQAAATDPRTGRIDMDMITTGRSTANRELEEALNMSIKELLMERRGQRMALSDMRKQLSEIMDMSSVQQDDLLEALRCMEADGKIQFNERAQTVFVRAGVLA